MNKQKNKTIKQPGRKKIFDCKEGKFFHAAILDWHYQSGFALLSFLLFCQSSCLFPSCTQISFNHWRQDAVFWRNAFPGHPWWRELKALPILLKCKSSPSRFHASCYCCLPWRALVGGTVNSGLFTSLIIINKYYIHYIIIYIIE